MFFLLRSRYPWQQLIEKPPTNRYRCAEKYPKDKNRNKRESKPNTIFNEIQQFAYVLGTKEREILFIQQSSISISRDTIHEGSTPIFIARKSQGFRKPQFNSTPKQKNSPNSNRRANSPVG